MKANHIGLMKTGVLHSRKQVFLYLNYRCVLRLKLKDSLIVFSNIVIHCTCRERSPYNSFTYFSLVLDRASSEFKANIYTMSATYLKGIQGLGQTSNPRRIE